MSVKDEGHSMMLNKITQVSKLSLVFSQNMAESCESKFFEKKSCCSKTRNLYKWL